MLRRMSDPRPRTDPLERLAVPVAGALRRAAALAVLSECLWAAQAALAGLAIGGLVAGPGLSPLVAAAGFLAVALLRVALDTGAEQAAQRAANRLVSDTRLRLAAAAALQTPRAERPAPAAVASLIAEKTALLAPWAARYRPAMARARVVPLVLLALVAPFSWIAALILLVAGPLIPLFMALVGMAARDASERQMAEIGSLNTLLADRIAAIADLRLLGAEARAETDLAAASDSLRARTMKVLAVAFLSSTVLELFSALGVAMVAVYVGFNLLGEIPFGSWGAPLSPAAAIFVLMIAPQFFQPMRDLAAAWHDRASALAVASEITETEAAFAASGSILGTGAAAAPLPPAPFSWQGLRLRPGPDAAPLAPPDGKVSPGEALGISGASGAGKTTLLAALAGLLRPDAGLIRWGDTPLDDTAADRIRAGIGWLPQAPRFIDAPLSEALTLGRPGDLAAALRAARAETIIAALPDGLSTRLGDLGGGVSGGEARRLMIARAQHAGAMLILADEPTADLDPETARAVLDGLLALRAQGAALVVASHDPVVLAAMDREVAL